MSRLPSLPIDRDGVKQFLPHREPALLIDRVTALSETTLTAELFVDPKWPIFEGHFPGAPVMPGVLIIEAVAQAGALIVAINTGLADGEVIAFSGVESAKFRRPVKPNSKLILEAEILRQRGGFYKFAGRALQGGDIAAELKFAATQVRL